MNRNDLLIQSNAFLTEAYNAAATELGEKTIAPWKGKKEVLADRILALQARLKPAKKSRRERKTPVNKVNDEYVAFLKAELAREDASHASAVRALMAKFPKALRMIVKHSAAAAGINPLTARNQYDRIRNAA